MVSVVDSLQIHKDLMPSAPSLPSLTPVLRIALPRRAARPFPALYGPVAAGHTWRRSSPSRNPAGLNLVPDLADPLASWRPARRSGAVWPAVPPANDAVVLAILSQLRESESWSPGRLLRHQLMQLEELLRFSARQVPFYAPRLAPLGPPGGELTLEGFRRVPLLRRADVQEAGEVLFSKAPPADHGRVQDVRTSGSTGRPVHVRSTELTSLVNAALAARYHQWHARDPEAPMAALITVRDGADAAPPKRWIPGFLSTPAKGLDNRRPIGEQIAWIEAQAPAYLVVYPSNLAALLRHSRETGFRPRGLREVLTMSEVLEQETRAACEEVWGVAVSDSYSCKEAGMIACQCPETGHYHVQAESLRWKCSTRAASRAMREKPGGSLSPTCTTSPRLSSATRSATTRSWVRPAHVAGGSRYFGASWDERATC